MSFHMHMSMASQSDSTVMCLQPTQTDFSPKAMQVILHLLQSSSESHSAMATFAHISFMSPSPLPSPSPPAILSFMHFMQSPMGDARALPPSPPAILSFMHFMQSPMG